MRLKTSIFFALSLMVFSSLTAPLTLSAKSLSLLEKNQIETAPIFPELKLPSIPNELTTPHDRASYLLLHFWDNMDWNNAEHIGNDYFMEQNLSTYFDLFNHVPKSNIGPAVERMIEQASVSSDAIEKICIISDLYLYDTQSPMMNEDYYHIIVDKLIKSKKISDYRATILEATIEDLSKNAVGKPAASFEVTTRDGKSTELKNLINKTGRTILFFYDPDCDDCAMAESLMQSNAIINNGISNGTIKVVAICPYTVETEHWATHANTLPKTWTVGFSPDGQVDEDGTYIFRASPTIYLLDETGIVIAKDIKYETLRELL